MNLLQSIPSIFFPITVLFYHVSTSKYDHVYIPDHKGRSIQTMFENDFQEFDDTAKTTLSSYESDENTRKTICELVTVQLSYKSVKSCDAPVFNMTILKKGGSTIVLKVLQCLCKDIDDKDIRVIYVRKRIHPGVMQFYVFVPRSGNGGKSRDVNKRLYLFGLYLLSFQAPKFYRFTVPMDFKP